MAQKELLTAWLNDAYAMENALVPILENHAKDAKDHPQVQAKIQEHLEKTRRHAELVKSCVERLGERTSGAKTGMATIFGALQSVSTGAAKDELVKNGIADFAAEHFEIASYKALIAAAQEYGDQETVRTCQQILRDEEEMARWLDQQLPMAVMETVRKQAA